jgi:hypothetical protein
MKPYRFVLGAALAALVLGAAPSRCRAQVLVPGDPPLTQEVVDLYQQMWQWYTAITLTPEQRRQHQQHFAAFWKKRDKFSNQQSLTGYRTMEKEWRALFKMNEPEQAGKRVEMREKWMAALGKSTQEVDRFLVAIYDDAYKPGGPNNPVVADGPPPLTRGHLDTHTEFAEYLLGIRLDADGRRTFHKLVADDYKTWDAAARGAFLDRVAQWKGMKSGRYEYRAKILPGYLDRQGDVDKTSTSERWLLEEYRTVYKPKADERPVALMGNQPPPPTAINAKFGFPADPNSKNIFDAPVVFTSSQTYLRIGDVDFYVSGQTGAIHQSHSYKWFFPNGRCYVRYVRCLGSTPVPGHEKDILVRTVYLDSEQVDEFWGRYTIDEKDRIRYETDKGEKLTLYLAFGREHVVWNGWVWSAPSKKK